MAIKLRPLTADEQLAITKLARSRSKPARWVERAKIILLASQPKSVPMIAQELKLSEKTVRIWLKRFNDNGLAGLNDLPRSGRPPTYTSAHVAEVIAAALTAPQKLGLPFASWTLSRLQTYLNEHKALAIKRSRIDQLLIAEGLRWRSQETWFGERVDPEFAEKRGRLSNFTAHHLRAVS
jgi:transposase